MSNSIRRLESAERELLTEHRSDDSPYSFVSSFNPTAWVRQWREFQGLAYQWSRSGEYEAFIQFDIANFYDNVNLDILERKIRSAVPAVYSSTVDLLFVFLRYWNRSIQGYAPKNIGIPQDEFSDCSRILANFYLQDYDFEIHAKCNGALSRAAYLRYADDQIVMANNMEQASELLFCAGRALHRLGFNINAGKVLRFESRQDYEFYWAFDLFAMLVDGADDTSINAAAVLFCELLKDSKEGLSVKEWKYDSVLRRLANIGVERLSEPHRTEIVNYLMEASFLEKCDERMLARIARGVRDEERIALIEKLEVIAASSLYSIFHHRLRQFFKEHFDPPRDTSAIEARINYVASL